MPTQGLAARPLAALAGALAACGGGQPPSEPAAEGAEHVLLITLDTLRADRLTVYGYDRPTTPRLAELAASATVYTDAHAPSPWTLPSHASMFTGLYPHEHGARTYPVEALEGTAFVNNAGGLQEDFVTVAEVLSEAGYETAAVAANTSFLKRAYGLAQGFDEYYVGRGQVWEINERALKWLDRRDEGPFFLFLNYMDTHRPLNEAARESFPAPELERSGYADLKQQLLMEEPVDPGDLRDLSIAYDLAVANLDDGLGQLFDELRARGLYDDMLIVVTSDHGEFLGEHSLIEHAKDVYREVAFIPLLIKQPGQTEGRVDDEVISLVHLPRILLEGARLGPDFEVPEMFASNWPRDFALTEFYGPRLRDLQQPWAERLDRVRRSISRGPYKYIASSDGRHELYDTSRDPGEQHDLIEREPEIARGLARELERWTAARAGAPAPGLVEVTQEHADELHALGYLGDEDDG